MTEEKTCIVCNAEKHLSLFYPRAARCKVCANRISRERYHANKEEISKKGKEYYAKNSERIKKRVNDYLISNLDAARERSAKYYAVNRERIRQKQNERQDPVKRADYRVRNKESISAYMKQWSAANPIKRRANEAKRRAAIGHDGYTEEHVQFLLRSQKSKCVVCNRSLKGGFEVDHIVPLSKGGANDRANTQLLCRTCNRRKHAKDPIKFMQANGFLL
jgi:5-methylcytosine-specific restriction endonuclease McrA